MNLLYMNIAIITGITGQDGSYLSELLLEKNYKIYGLIRKTSVKNTDRIEHLLENDNFNLNYFDLNDSFSFLNILNILKKEKKNIKVIEIYNLGAISDVKISFSLPEYYVQTNSISVINILESIKISPLRDIIKLYQASTSELFGLVQEVPQKETTAFYPRSPYGISKLCSYWFIKNYREAYNMFCSNGILFNHESPRRGNEFVTRKITIGLSNIIKGKQDYITLGNIYAKRDWGHAKDYVEGMWRILQYSKPDDFILSTNEFHTVKEFIELAFKLKGFIIKWKGSGLDEVGYDENTNKILINISKDYYRPTEVQELIGDSSKAKDLLGWSSNYTFEELVKEMVEFDCK